jgi:ATP-dependent RNA helicase RhlE
MTSTSSSVTFASLALAAPLQRALADKGYTHPSPIQARAIPALLEGRDMIGIAQTGTGKTAAFALPLLHRLAATPAPRVPRQPRALILTPTRELAVQIADNLVLYGRHLPIRTTLVFGGVGEQPQIRSLAAGTDIVVATPGRLLDLMNQRHLSLDRVETFILDEADRMLDMGFAPDVKRVLAKLPSRRQSLLFSATMPDPIRQLAQAFLHDPVRVEVAPAASTAERIDQRVCHVGMGTKRRALVHLLQNHADDGLTLVFVRMKHGADRVVKQLAQDGITAHAIHGNKSQGARQRALESFRSGASRVLIATDIAARGIDVKGISLVINYDLPNEPEAYVHRIGRTARAGADGIAVSLCDESESVFLRDIQRLIRRDIPVMHLPELSVSPPSPGGPSRGSSSRPSQGQRRGAQGVHAHGGRSRSSQGGRSAATAEAGGHPTGEHAPAAAPSRVWGRLSRWASRRSR